MHQIRFLLGLPQTPLGEFTALIMSLQRSPEPLAVFKGTYMVYFSGEQKGGKKKGKERVG